MSLIISLLCVIILIIIILFLIVRSCFNKKIKINHGKIFGFNKPRNWLGDKLSDKILPRTNPYTVDKLNIIQLRLNNHYEEEKTIGNLKNNLDQAENPDEVFQEIRESLALHVYLKHHPQQKYNPKNIATNEDTDTDRRIRRSCKISLEFFSNCMIPVIFVLDEMDFKQMLQYEKDKQNKTFPLNRKAFTQSELNFLIRRYVRLGPNDKIFDTLTFQSNGRDMEFPWTEEAEAKLHSSIVSRMLGLGHSQLDKDRREYFKYYTEVLKRKGRDENCYWCEREVNTKESLADDCRQIMEKIREQLKCKHLGYVCFIIAHTKQIGILFNVQEDLENVIAQIFKKIDEQVNILSLGPTEQAVELTYKHQRETIQNINTTVMQHTENLIHEIFVKYPNILKCI